MAKALCVIEQLITTPFQTRSVNEQLDIVRSGRPCPELPTLKVIHEDKSSMFIRHFHTSQYSKISWLTGSSKLEKLFCWPCLLFSNEQTVWNNDGYKNLNNISNAVKKHERSQNHITALLRFKIFVSSRIDEQLLKDTTQRNETLRKNGRFLKRLIDVVCFLATHELPFRENYEIEGSTNGGIYIGALELLSTYDSNLSAHLELSSFRETSVKIQNGLIRAVTDIVLSKIKEEIGNSTCVALLLDETSDAMNLSRLSTTLRYVHSETGDVHERCVSFIDLSGDRLEGLLNHVMQIVNEFNLKDKLVAQTYDGAVMMGGDMSGVKAKIQEACPKAISLHHFGHSLDLILYQSVLHIRECCIFFKTLLGLGSFFSKSSKRTYSLLEFTRKEIQRTTPIHWNFCSRLVQTVKEQKTYLEGFFQNVLDDSADWDGETVVAAQGFIMFLTDFHASFLLLIFNQIFSYTDVLFDTLQSKELDILYCIYKVEETKCAIGNHRHDFGYIWNEALAYQDQETEPPVKQPCLQANPKAASEILYHKILDNVIKQLNELYGSLSALEYMSLIDPNKYGDYKKTFPHSALESLKQAHANSFDFARLQNELVVLHSFEELNGKHPHELVRTLKRRKLDTVLPEVYKLGLLISTIPISTSVEGTVSALKRVKSYLWSTQCQEQLSDLAVISIEKEVLSQLKSTATFHDDVINHFTKQGGRLDFTFK